MGGWPPEERTFAIMFRASADTVVGELGTVDLVLSTRYGAGEVADAAPADNTVGVTVTASDDSSGSGACVAGRHRDPAGNARGA